jgi:DNA polymerase alpha subunit B
MLPNPAHFSINGVTFASTSVDTLFHLKKEEFIRRADEIDAVPVLEGSSATDVMSNLCRHVLYQRRLIGALMKSLISTNTLRSFYPIFPTPVDVAHEVNLDVSHMAGLDLCPGANPTAPNVLVIPSRLKHFTKVLTSLSYLAAVQY